MALGDMGGAIGRGALIAIALTLVAIQVFAVRSIEHADLLFRLGATGACYPQLSRMAIGVTPALWAVPVVSALLMFLVATRPAVGWFVASLLLILLVTTAALLGFTAGATCYRLLQIALAA